MGKHVTKYFQDWIEENLDASSRKKVDEHLKDCSVCQLYYQKLSLALKPIEVKDEFNLTPDPLLPAKIDDLLSGKVSRKVSPIPVLRWSFASVAVIVACWVGITLGTGIADTGEEEYCSELFYDYYEAFSQQGISNNLNFYLISEGNTNEN